MGGVNTGAAGGVDTPLAVGSRAASVHSAVNLCRYAVSVGVQCLIEGLAPTTVQVECDVDIVSPALGRVARGVLRRLILTVVDGQLGRRVEADARRAKVIHCSHDGCILRQERRPTIHDGSQSRRRLIILPQDRGSGRGKQT